MKGNFVQRLARLGRPGLFGAALAAIAVSAAAAYVSKLSTEIDTVLDDIESTREEIEVLETTKASLSNEVAEVGKRRDELLALLHQSMEQDIHAGKYDEAVLKRATEIHADWCKVSAHIPMDGESVHV